ncbi:MAG: SdpI family protein [Candidatus Magnetominusculus sp. LBB02]|nr:SdpI family protein [Candidatus Magnetominusculus sp. LBB02]
MFSQRPPAVIIFCISIPLILGLIPRNRFYGVRNKKTLSDDDIWYRGNRLGGVALMIASLAYMITALIFPYHKEAADNFSIWQIHFGVLLVSLTGSLAVTSIYIRRL